MDIYLFWWKIVEWAFFIFWSKIEFFRIYIYTRIFFFNFDLKLFFKENCFKFYIIFFFNFDIKFFLGKMPRHKYNIGKILRGEFRQSIFSVYFNKIFKILGVWIIMSKIKRKTLIYNLEYANLNIYIYIFNK